MSFANDSTRVLPRSYDQPRKFAGCGLLTALAFALSCSGQQMPEGYQGVIEFDEQVIAAEVPGRVREVLARRGQFVADHQELVRLDDTLAKLSLRAHQQAQASAEAQLALLRAGTRQEELQSTEAALRGSRAQLSFARRAATQARLLGQTGSIANSAVDRAGADLALAEAEHTSLERKLAAMRAGSRVEEVTGAEAHVASLALETALEEEKVERHALRAKGGGMVVDLSVEVGELAAVGTPVVTVADVTHPYAEVFVPQGELDGIRIGSKASVRVDGVAQTFVGVVEYVSPKTEFTPRYLFSEQERPHLVFRVRIRIDDEKARLHAGVPTFALIAR